ncbi:MAG: metallophosphoesterase [Holophagales bacterium]|nr:metallophosphoesterase [Holophagales bacterium]
MKHKYLILGAATIAATALTFFLACSGSSNKVSIPDPALVQQSQNIWRFGVMGDTQWTVSTDTARNPNTVAVEIIKQVNEQFISKGVEFVIQVGDITDTANNTSLQTTAKYRQPLYNAGIGFYPLRGNHESSAANAAEFIRVFPQTRTGVQNNSPADVLSLSTTAGDIPKTGTTFTVGSGFSSPNNYDGLSYSFSHKNATFVILDQFSPVTGTYAGLENVIGTQQSWINNVLNTRATSNLAFVFSHKGLIHEDHNDVLFGANCTINPTDQNNFINSLSTNGVKYMHSGHDHMHSRSVYTNTTGTASVQQITGASNSAKFYTPVTTARDAQNLAAFGRNRQTMLVQELYTVGYYIYTVDGNNVTVDYYSSIPVTAGADINTVPVLAFTKKETFGYNLKGKAFVVAQGGAYNVVQDGNASILSGTNGFSMVDGSSRLCSHEVTTGWTTRTTGLYTDVFTLWGMANEFVGSEKTDTYCLSISYDTKDIEDGVAKSGRVGIATKGEKNWVNAVSKNIGSTATITFVDGPYDASKHTLGHWGVDVANHRFWAVVNYNGDFAVAPSI